MPLGHVGYKSAQLSRCESHPHLSRTDYCLNQNKQDIVHRISKRAEQFRVIYEDCSGCSDLINTSGERTSEKNWNSNFNLLSLILFGHSMV